MKRIHTLSIAGLFVAVMVFAAGISRAESINLGSVHAVAQYHFNIVLNGNSNGGVVGSVQDSSNGKPIDTTGKWVHDSTERAHKDSINRANHIQDSLKHALMDSINRANHIRDSINHARQDSINKANHGDHGRDSTNKAREDSLRAAGHHRDSLNRLRADSLKHLAHSRDSINHVRRDSIKRIMHRRDSIVHARLDSLIRVKHDSSHHGVIDLQNQSGEISKSITSDAVPGEAILAQNYPNPFGGASNSTSIDFTLPVNQQVTIVVYNAAGQNVSTLVNGNLSAGTHSVTFDASTLPAGLYFYKLVTESGTMTKRMIKVH